MPAFSIKKAREGNVISDKELERFGVLFMICQDQIKITGKQYEQAAADFGGTVGSFQFAYREAIRKLKAKNCYIDEGDETAIPAAEATSTTPKKGREKKRKAAAENSDGEQSSKKSRGEKTTAVKMEAGEEDDSF